MWEEGRAMHAIINRIHFGNFRFIIELEIAPEIEPGQLTLWVAEKIDVSTLPLNKFTVEQLIYAVREPWRARLYQQLKEEKQELQHAFTERLSSAEDLKPRHLRKRTRELLRQQEDALTQVEHTLLRDKLLTLDRADYNLEILQAESHLFAEDRFLRRLREGEMDEDEIRQFCFEFAFDRARREQVLAEATRQPQPPRPVFEEEQYWGER
jgi:hypothetical protein